MPVLADSEVWGSVADMLAPPERLRPSEWAERYRVLKEGTTDQPGPWRNDYYPWLTPIMDAPVDFPHKRGSIFKKCGQSGGSERGINSVGWRLDSRPGPILYLTTTDDQAKEFSRDRFEYMIASAPVLQTRRLSDRRNPDTVHVKRFAGGKLAIWGSGSPSKLMSEPYQVVCLDEVDQLPNFPGVGSAWALAEIRMRSFRETWLDAWSTPTTEKRGIALKWDELSDQRRFYVPCPHCGVMEWLKWGQVRIEGRRAETVKYVCEHCQQPITDLERVGAVSRGQYRSALEPEEAARRRYVGFHISRLYSPSMPLMELAAIYLACSSEAALQVFFNADLGEAYTSASRPLTEEDVKARQTRSAQEPAPAEIEFVTAGIDVQAGQMFYFDISGWTSDAMKYLLECGRVQGWERLRAHLRGFEAEKQGGGKLNIRACAIDSMYETSKVYNFCLSVGQSFIVPVRYGNPYQGEQWSSRKPKTAPGIVNYVLQRAHWLDRALGRFGGGEDLAGVILPLVLSDEYRAHILAPTRIATIDDRSGREKITWETHKSLHDDYAHAAAYAEFAAVLCGLDKLQMQGEAFLRARKALRARRPEVGEGGWVDRGYRKRRGGWLRKT